MQNFMAFGSILVLFVYFFIAPALFAIAMRVVLWFGELMGVPEALGRFGSVMINSYREKQSSPSSAPQR